eukprot:Filipodium_phascolosomae@DN1808_c0_g1_i1.p1
MVSLSNIMSEWCSGITSRWHREDPGFSPLFVQLRVATVACYSLCVEKRPAIHSSSSQCEVISFFLLGKVQILLNLNFDSDSGVAGTTWSSYKCRYMWICYRKCSI